MADRFLTLVVGALAALSMAPAMATAAQHAAPPTFGHWSERDISNLAFDIRSGPKPAQVAVVIPASVTFPGSHEFVLAKQPDGSFTAPQERGRPKVSLTFDSATKAHLRVRGSGETPKGTWITMNDFTLVRP